tara:strand:- start:16 stop:645 length:630 start_codon:yes stop_codon:yes gene_type:complete
MVNTGIEELGSSRTASQMTISGDTPQIPNNPERVTPQPSTEIIYKPSQAEKVFNWISAVFYLAGFGLSIYSTVLIFKYFVGGATKTFPPGIIPPPQIVEDLETVSILVCSFLILMAFFCFLGMIASIRWAIGKFGKGDHIPLFVFNCFLLILSFISAMTYGLAFGATEELAGSSPGTEISIPLGTSIAICVISFIFIMIYLIYPSYLTK